MKRYCLVLLALHVLSACTKPPVQVSPSAPAREVALPPAPNRPDWVTQKPALANYYNGIGVERTDRADYQRLAKDKALEDLASEINIQVQANTVLSQQELGNTLREYYRSDIRTKTLSQLQDFELVETWSDGRHYWTYYRLSKEAYAQQQQQLRADAKRLAVWHIKMARFQETNAACMAAFTNYLQALEALSAFLHEPLIALVEDNEEVLSTYALSGLQRVLQALSVAEQQISQHPGQPLVLRLLYQAKAAVGIPVKVNQTASLSNQRGELRIAPMMITEERGLLGIQVAAIHHTGLAADQHLLRQLLDRFLQYPRFELPLVIAPLKMQIVGEDPSIKLALQEQLTASGVVLQEQDTAAYRLSFELHITSDTAMPGFEVAWANLDIACYNARGQLLFSKQLHQVKGIHSSRERAARAAVANLAPLIRAEIIDPLLKHLL